MPPGACARTFDRSAETCVHTRNYIDVKTKYQWISFSVYTSIKNFVIRYIGVSSLFWLRIRPLKFVRFSDCRCWIYGWPMYIFNPRDDGNWFHFARTFKPIRRKNAQKLFSSESTMKKDININGIILCTIWLSYDVNYP